MEMDINEIIDYYAAANVSFSDAYAKAVCRGSKGMGQTTSQTSSGLVFPFSGSACFTINGTPYVIEPGMVVHAGPDMTLDKEVIGDDDWSYAVVHYRLSREELLRFPLYNRHFSFHIGVNARVEELIGQLLQHQAMPGGMSAIRAKTIFSLLLEEIMLSAKRQFQDENSELMTRAAEYIRNHYAEPLSIAQIALQFGMERRRFAYLFEKHAGLSPMSYLSECRIRRSRELLRTCECSVAQVAASVGYMDHFYFSRYFKKQTGLTPTEYRKQFRSMKQGMAEKACSRHIGGASGGKCP